jgi:hypothetical protein
MLIKEHECHDGIQKIYRFENNYGASVVRHSFSYGGKKGLYEVALLKFSSPDNNEEVNLTYENDFEQDVIGWLREEEVEDLLNKIKKY